MAKKKKDKKKKLKMPKLSFADQLIYAVLYVLFAAILFLIGFVPLFAWDRIAFADPNVAAATEHMSILWFFVPFATVLIMGIGFLVSAQQDRRPIFGRKEIQYGPPKYPKIYPLFMKDKPPVWVSENKKQSRKAAAIALIVVLLLSFVPYPWSFFGRDCLYKDGSVGQYSMFNRKTHSFSPVQITAVKIKTYRSHTKGGPWYYGVNMTLTTDTGKTYSFDSNEFGADAGSHRWLEDMLAIKDSYVSARITYETEYPLETVIEDKALTEQEAQRLYRLFGAA